MDNTLNFYICIPVYNTEKYVSECIQSVLSQTYQGFRVVIIDDGSTDNSGLICDSFKEKDERIIVKHEKNEGLWSARTKAIDYINNIENDKENTYLLFLDSDDTLKENALFVLSEYIMNNKVDMLIYGYDWVMENGNLKKRVTHENQNLGLIHDKGKLYRIVYFDESYNALWRKAVKLKLFTNKVGYNYQPIYGEDLLRSINLYLNCESVFLLKDSLYNYKIVSSSITHSVKLEPLVNDFCYVNSCVKEAFFREPLINNKDVLDYFDKLLNNIEQIIQAISISTSKKNEKIRLFKVLKDDAFAKLVIKSIKRKSVAIYMLENEKFLFLIIVGQISYFMSKIKNKINSWLNIRLFT